jgi:hypothetical protein
VRLVNFVHSEKINGNFRKINSGYSGAGKFCLFKENELRLAKTNVISKKINVTNLNENFV